MSDRLPPHSPEAEVGVLGCILLEPNELLGEVIQALPNSQAFYDLRHRTIFETLRAMETDRVPVDSITLHTRLHAGALLESAGGREYVSVLADKVPSAANLSYYLGIVREKFTMRRWIALCGDVTRRIFEQETDSEALIAHISTELFQLCEADQRPTEKFMREVVADVQEEYFDKFQRGKPRKIGPQTGFNYLDNIIPGFGAGQLIVIAARPSTGKSALMMQIAEYMAYANRIPCAIFSLEMTATSLGARSIFQHGGADLTKFLNGFMSEEDVQKLVAASARLAPLPLLIDEAADMCIEDLEIRARRMRRRHSIGVIFIDYFQLLYVRNRHRNWSKADELGEVSKRLKRLAKELRIPIIVCAQMNREIEREAHRRPRLSDLRDTGQLEQDADVVMFLWKPNTVKKYWEKRIPDILSRMPVRQEWRQKRGWKKYLTVVTCTVEKQREARSHVDATLIFIQNWTRFVDAYPPAGIGQDEPEPGPTELEMGEEEDDDE